MAEAQRAANEHQEARTDDGRAWVLLTHDLSSSLTVLKGRVQLLRRRLHQDVDTARLETDLNAIETELTRLTKFLERINRGSGRGWAGQG